METAIISAKDKNIEMNRCDNRSINDIKAWTSYSDSNLIQKNMFDEIILKPLLEKVEKSIDKITIVDIGVGQWICLEQIAEQYWEKWNLICVWIWKYNEREKKSNISSKWHYIQEDLSNELPKNMNDNTIDFIYSFFSLQYIDKVLHLIKDIKNKLKPWWKALLNLWLMHRFDPSILQELQEKNPLDIKKITILKWQIFLELEKTIQNELQIPNYASKKEVILSSNYIKNSAYKEWLLNILQDKEKAQDILNEIYKETINLIHKSKYLKELWYSYYKI